MSVSRRKRKVITLALGVLTLMGGLFAWSITLLKYPEGWIKLNQTELAALDHSYSMSLGERSLLYISNAFSVVQAYVGASTSSFSYDDSESVLRYVFERFPLVAVVLPTESYYYYSLTDQEGPVAGNIRLTDIEDGVISFGYFRPENRKARSKGGLFEIDKDLTTQKISKHVWLLSYKGISRLFILPSVSDSAPKNFFLRPQESYLTSMRDESGNFFHVIFKSSPPAFLYVLDQEHGKREDLRPLGEGLYQGARSGFVYKQFENERMVLAGVKLASVRENNYFDGPFDQVPARFEIRDEVYAAYPYLKLSGVDEYGYLCSNRGTRTAISSYMTYESPFEVSNRVKKCEEKSDDPNLIEHCITFDEKQAFHLASAAFNRDGSLKNPVGRSVCHHNSAQRVG